MATARERLESAPIGVVVVGDWPAVPSGRLLRWRRLAFQHGPTEARLLKEVIAADHPGWLLIGDAVEEPAVRSLAMSGLAMHPELQLAMLGYAHDLRRCARWVRRGCCVYMECSAGLERVATALDAASTLRVVVVDRVFLDADRARQVPPVGSLTRREDEVLQLLCRGLRNADIASALHLAESTVEFHVGRVLGKLGARNRVEAVERAFALGLA